MNQHIHHGRTMTHQKPAWLESFVHASTEEQATKILVTQFKQVTFLKTDDFIQIAMSCKYYFQEHATKDTSKRPRLAQLIFTIIAHMKDRIAHEQRVHPTDNESNELRARFSRALPDTYVNEINRLT